jgi:hypothetical protein
MEYQEYCETDRNQRTILKNVLAEQVKEWTQFTHSSPKNPATDRNAEKEKSKENIWLKKEIGEFDDEKKNILSSNKLFELTWLVGIRLLLCVHIRQRH